MNIVYKAKDILITIKHINIYNDIFIKYNNNI